MRDSQRRFGQPGGRSPLLGHGQMGYGHHGRVFVRKLRPAQPEIHGHGRGRKHDWMCGFKKGLYPWHMTLAVKTKDTDIAGGGTSRWRTTKFYVIAHQCD